MRTFPYLDSLGQEQAEPHGLTWINPRMRERTIVIQYGAE